MPGSASAIPGPKHGGSTVPPRQSSAVPRPTRSRVRPGSSRCWPADTPRAVHQRLPLGQTRSSVRSAQRVCLRTLRHGEGNGVPGGGLSCRTREDELAVLMPQTAANRAESILAALRASLHARPPAGTDWLIVSAGITELTAADDPGSVFERAEQALWQARQAGEGTVVVTTAKGDSRRQSKNTLKLGWLASSSLSTVRGLARLRGCIPRTRDCNEMSSGGSEF